VLVGEGIELVDQPFRMHPTQRVQANVELAGIVAQHDRVTQEFMRVNAAPNRTFGGDGHRIGRDAQGGETQPFELSRPGCLVEEDRLRLCGQSGDQGRG
jgi:hypothetical protein